MNIFLRNFKDSHPQEAVKFLTAYCDRLSESDLSPQDIPFLPNGAVEFVSRELSSSYSWRRNTAIICLGRLMHWPESLSEKLPNYQQIVSRTHISLNKFRCPSSAQKVPRKSWFLF